MVTKTAVKPAPVPKNAVTTTGNNPPPAFLDKMKEDAGKGTNFTQDDRIIPLIYILQANSPQVKPRDPKYVEGATAGDIWLKNSIKKEIIGGDEGFDFQPCYWQKVWLEWKKDRGGYVGIHMTRPGDATEQEITKDDGSVVKAWVRENDNLVVETRQYFGYADGQPYVVPFSSSGHTVARNWNNVIDQFTIPGTKDQAPIWSRKYHFTTINRTNAKNQSWDVFKIVDQGWVSEDEYEAGKLMHESLVRGELKAAAMDEGEHPDGGSGDSGGKADEQI